MPAATVAIPPSASPRLSVAWHRSAFPDDFSCRTYAGGCDWLLVPALGGMVLASPTRSGFAWRWDWSEDGRHWTRLRGLPASTSMLEPDGTPTGAFAFTETWPDEDARAGALWRTSDGVDWQRVADTTGWGEWLELVQADRRYLVVAGGGDQGSPTRLFVSDGDMTWDEVQIPGMPTAGAVHVDGSSAGFIAQWWPEDQAAGMFSTSDDGRTWTTPAPYPDAAVTFVYRVQAGYVAFGVEGDNVDLDSQYGTLSTAWTSTDGVTWARRQAAGLPPRTGDSIDREGTFVQVPGGFLVDMMIGSRFALFFSPDGLEWQRLPMPERHGCAVESTRWATVICVGDGWRYWTAHLPLQ